MQRKANMIYLMAAIILAAAAGVGAHFFLSAKVKDIAASKTKISPVVVAAVDLPAGETLQKSDLNIQAWPQSGLPAGHFPKIKDIVGRIVAGNVVAGEVIVRAKLLKKGFIGGMSAIVATGMRAVTVKVNEVIGVAGFIKPHDRVDVICTVQTGTFQQDPVTRVVLQDVEVLAVGITWNSQEQKKTKKKGGGKSKGIQVVTLQLEPDHAERLALAATEGKILLALRNQADRGVDKTDGIKLTRLFAVEAPPAPPAVAKKPAAPKPKKKPKKNNLIEIIKGVKLTNLSFPES